jgi:hypothetical protein
MIAWRQSAGQRQAGQGRKPAEPVARNASLDGPVAIRQRPAPSDHGSDQLDGTREVHTVPWCALIPDSLLGRSSAAHLAWCRCRLSKNNVQTNAYDHVRPAAHRGFYLAISRSAVSSSPIPREPLPNCDQTKTRPGITRAGFAHVCCSPYAESLVTGRASRGTKWIEARTQELPQLCGLFADRMQEATSRGVSVERDNVRVL